MKAKDIKVGSVYVARVAGKLTEVRVDDYGCGTLHGTERRVENWYVTNLCTGRKTTFRSAAKFRREVPPTVGDEHKKIKTRLRPIAGPNSETIVEEINDAPDQTGERRDGPDPGPIDPNPDGVGEPAPVVGGGGTGSAGPGQLVGLLAQQAPGRVDERPAGAPDHPVAPAGLADRLGTIALKPQQRIPTAEQQAIIDAARSRVKVLIVQAGAGTGKTATDVMLSESLGGRGQYTAFNAPLCAEAKTKMPPHVAVNTIHSLAFRAEGHKYKDRLDRGRVKAEETAKMLGLSPLEFGPKRLAPGFLAGQVLGAIRRFCNSADTEIGEQHFNRIDGLDQPHEGINNERLRTELLPFARKAWNDIRDPKGQFPFSHDAYAKLWQLSNPVISTDYLLVDEAQDLVPRDLAIIAVQTCQVILVGDDAQTIYAWRGCVNAMSAFPDAPRLLLTQSFRFGPAIAAVANAVLETLDEPTALRLKGLPSIPSRVITQGDKNGRLDQEGERGRGETQSVVAGNGRANNESDTTTLGQLRDVREKDVGPESGNQQQLATILCRTNACAVANLLTAMAGSRCPKCDGVGALNGTEDDSGSDIECSNCNATGRVKQRPFLVGGGADVIAFVEAAQSLKEGRGTSHPELACFGSWREVEEYTKLDEGEDLRLMVKLIKEFGCRVILDALRRMPEEEYADFVISTCHKSKGREWGHVRLASDFPTLSKAGDPEKKLIYVAVTRAKLTLDVSGCPFFVGQDSIDVSKLKEVQGAEIKILAAETTKGSNGSGENIQQTFDPVWPEQPSDSSSGGTSPRTEKDTHASHGPRPVRAPAPLTAPAQYTWVKSIDDFTWFVEGPKGGRGEVEIFRRNGTSSRKTLQEVAWENGVSAIYSVGN